METETNTQKETWRKQNRAGKRKPKKKHLSLTSRRAVREDSAGMLEEQDTIEKDIPRTKNLMTIKL